MSIGGSWTWARPCPALILVLSRLRRAQGCSATDVTTAWTCADACASPEQPLRTALGLRKCQLSSRRPLQKHGRPGSDRSGGARPQVSVCFRALALQFRLPAPQHGRVLCTGCSKHPCLCTSGRTCCAASRGLSLVRRPRMHVGYVMLHWRRTIRIGLDVESLTLTRTHPNPNPKPSP